VRALQRPEHNRGILYGMDLLVILFGCGRERETG